MSSSHFKLVLYFSLSTTLVGQGLGGQSLWINGTSVNNSWSTPSNWVPGAPTILDDACFFGWMSGAGPYVVVQDFAMTARTYQVAAADVTFEGSNLQHVVQEFIQVGLSTADSSAHFRNGTWTPQWSLVTDQQASGAMARVDIGPAALVRTMSDFGSGVTDWISASSGAAIFEVHDGGQLESGVLAIGDFYDTAAPSTATLHVSGTTSHVRPNSIFGLKVFVGYNHYGEVVVDQGGTIDASSIYAGVNSADASITVDGVGSRIASTELWLNATAGSQSNLTVRNSGIVHVDAELLTSDPGTGAISVQSQGKIEAATIHLAISPGVITSVQVENDGTEVRGNAASIIGDQGIGLVTVLDAGAWVTPSCDLGYGAGGLGSMSVDGVGSKLVVTGNPSGRDLTLGRQGRGELYVRTGATAEVAGNVSLGEMPSGFGLLELQDANMHATGSFIIGGTTPGTGGNGSLAVKDGGTLRVDEWMHVAVGNLVDVSNSGSVVIGTGPASPSANSVTVVAGGLLDGGGIFRGNVEVQGGAISPGGLLHPMIAENSVDLESGVYRLFVQDTAVYSRLSVTGVTMIGPDMALELLVDGSYVPNYADVFPVMTANSIAGCFRTTQNRVIGTSVTGNPVVMATFQSTTALSLSPRMLGDFNGDGVVSGADYTIWADAFGQQFADYARGDANGDGKVTGADFTLWADNFGGQFGEGGATRLDQTVGEMGFGATQPLLQPIAESAGTSDLQQLPSSPIDFDARETLLIPEPPSFPLVAIATLFLFLGRQWSTARRWQIGCLDWDPKCASEVAMARVDGRTRD